MPEINRSSIGKADLIANPGCYPTSVILGLLPIIKTVAGAGLNVIVDSKSGTTGAGRKSSNPLIFSDVDENFKSYKANDHQHIPEMENVLSISAGSSVKVNFVPHLLPVRRGILSTIYLEHKGLPPAEELHKIYSDRYKDEPFVRVRPLGGDMPQLLETTGTNYCDIGIKVARGMVVIVSVIDNLVKGASGQAVQNMNIMFGLDEKSGLI
jgi:N-acetyl-gamma-glutamyl-phosphate reductase